MPFVIDSDPIAFTLVGIPGRWYGLIFVGAAGVGIWLAQREARRRGVGDEVVSDAVMWVAVAALVGGRALYIIQNELGSIASDPFHAFMIWQGGLSVFGGRLVRARDVAPVGGDLPQPGGDGPARGATPPDAGLRGARARPPLRRALARADAAGAGPGGGAPPGAASRGCGG